MFGIIQTLLYGKVDADITLLMTCNFADINFYFLFVFMERKQWYVEFTSIQFSLTLSHFLKVQMCMKYVFRIYGQFEKTSQFLWNVRELSCTSIVFISLEFHD